MTTDPTTAPTTDPTADDQPLPDMPTSPERSRYALYDTQLLRFVGGVHDSVKAARAAGKAADRTGARYDVRKV